MVDLRPGGAGEDPELKRLMIGRAAKLERLGLAEQIGSARWELKPGLEPALRDLGVRGDIIKTMHRAMMDAGHEPDITGFALHGDQPAEPVLGRLVARGLHDELQGSAYVVVEGVDGRTHHLTFPDLELTGDAKPGAIVESRSYEDRAGRRQLSLATKSDLPIEAQITAHGATWIDRQLLAKDVPVSGGGFSAEVRVAMDRRVDHLVEEGLALRRGERVSSRAISSTPCAGPISRTPRPSSQPRRGSLIALPPRASTSRASTASGSRSGPAIAV